MQNNNVRRSPLNQKQQFLRSKGLNEDEIQIACERAGVFTTDPNSTIINIGSSTTTAGLPVVQYQPQVKLTTFQRIKDIAGTTAFIAGIAYGVYLFYKVIFREIHLNCILYSYNLSHFFPEIH